jgi:plastocyanin
MSERTTARAWMIAAGLAGLGALTAIRTVGAAAPDDDTRVVIKNFMFQPTTITVKAGATVIWTNGDGEPHTVVSDSGLFRSAALDTNDSYSFKFDKPGTYRFVCSIHPQMVGTVVVK